MVGTSSLVELREKDYHAYQYFEVRVDPRVERLTRLIMSHWYGALQSNVISDYPTSSNIIRIE